MNASNLEVYILRDKTKDFSFKHIAVDKFNENYHKYVSNTHNEYFAIPVSNISNLFLVYDRKSMPAIFRPITVEYRLEILRMHSLADMDSGNSKGEINSIIYSNILTTEVNTPHDLFTFIYNLNELTLFNTFINDPNNISSVMTDIGSLGDMFVFNVSWYSIKDDKNITKKEINGIFELIAALENKYMMGLNVSYPFELRFNYDGSSAYSDPNELFSEKRAELIGNTECSEYILNLALPNMEIPVHTFITNEDYQMLGHIETYDQFRGGSVTFFMGTPFDTNIVNAMHGNIFINDSNFATRKSSTICMKEITDFVIYLKLAPDIIRTIDMLVNLAIDYTLEDVDPGFNYEVSLFDPDALNRPIKPMNYARNFILRDCSMDSSIHGVVNDYNVAIHNKTKNIENFEPYKHFIKDITDFYIPF
jgi:hypothetical protein